MPQLEVIVIIRKLQSWHVLLCDRRIVYNQQLESLLLKLILALRTGGSLSRLLITDLQLRHFNS